MTGWHSRAKRTRSVKRSSWKIAELAVKPAAARRVHHERTDGSVWPKFGMKKPEANLPRPLRSKALLSKALLCKCWRGRQKHQADRYRMLPTQEFDESGGRLHISSVRRDS